MTPHRRFYRAAVSIIGAVGLLTAAAAYASGSTKPKPVIGYDSSLTRAPAAAEVGHPTKAICNGRHYTIGFDVYSHTDGFSIANIDDFMKVSKQLGCVTPVILVDNADPTTIIQNINTFVERHVDGVILAQVVAAAQPGVMAILNKAHIPTVATYVVAPTAPFIDVNDGQAGYKGGLAVGQAFAKKYPGVKPYVIIGQFPEGGPVSVQRMNGFQNGVEHAISGIPSDQILGLDTKADPPTANTETSSVLQRIPSNGKIIFSGINDVVTYAMLQAIKSAGREGDAMAMGMGGDPGGRGFMCSNQPTYYGTVGFFPDRYFNYLLPAVIGMINGERMPQRIVMPVEVLTAATVKQYYSSAAC